MKHSQPTSAKRRNWIPCGCLLLMFLTCVFTPVAMYVAWTFRASAQVKSQLARIQDAGLPTDIPELAAYYRLEEGVPDATAIYVEAQRQFSGNLFEADCRELPIVGNGELEIPPPGQPWAEQEAVENFLANYADGLQVVHEAAALGGAARFPLEFADGYAMLLPHAQDMRTCARMLALEAHVKAHQGDAEGVAEAILDMVKISRSLENQPVLVSQLVRIAIHGMAVNLVDELLPHVNFSDEDLARLQLVFRRDDFKQGISRALVGERVIGAEAFKNPGAALGNELSSPAGKLIKGSNEDLAFFLKIHSDMHDGVEMEYPAMFPAVDTAMSQLHAKIGTPLGRLRYVMTALTLPAVEACVVAAARGDGMNRCVDAALAVELFRRREGRLPASLDELVPNFLPAIPIDPYDGQPIRYVAEKDAYTLYICGRDRVDNGGLEDEQRSDEVIRIELPATAASTGDPVPVETPAGQEP